MDLSNLDKMFTEKNLVYRREINNNNKNTVYKVYYKNQDRKTSIIEWEATTIEHIDICIIALLKVRKEVIKDGTS